MRHARLLWLAALLAAAAQPASPAPRTPISHPSTVTPTVQAAAYAAGNTIGGLLQLSAGMADGCIRWIGVSFTSGARPPLDVIFFNANPTASTITDKTQIAIASADVGNIIGIVHVTDCTLLGASAPSFCQAGDPALSFDLSAGQVLYAAVVARSLMTLNSTSDMTIRVTTSPRQLCR